MEMLVWNGVWAIVSYFIVKKVQEKYPNLNVNEWLYVAGSLILGAVYTWIFLACKVYEHKNYGKFSK